MTEVVSPSVNQKRKFSEDSEDELFFSFENKKRVSDEGVAVNVASAQKNTKNEPNETELDTPVKKTLSEKNSNSNETLNTETKSNTEPKTAEKENEVVKPKTNAFDTMMKTDSGKKLKTSATSSPAPKAGIQTKLSFKTATPQKTSPEKPKIPPVIQNPNGEWKIEDYLYDEQWKKLLQDEFSKKYFIEINNFIKDGYKKNIFRPPKELVFNALNSTKLKDIKVVILGQDPYHDDGQAHGLAFSVPVGIRIPPSLKNIFIELRSDIPDFQNDERLGGYLQKWTERGVFLLNTFLTVEAHKAGSHSKIGWETFTDRVIKLISEKNDGCAFMLWGNFAQRKEGLIDKKRHKIIKCAHPSPFSCQRFFGSKCFSQANDFLKSVGKTPVNWSFK